MYSLETASKLLSRGEVSSRELIEVCLTKARSEEGDLSFIELDANGALSAASKMDRMRKVGCEPSAFGGIPISVKDAFDIQGQVTRAGSKILSERPALADATAIRRLRNAGFVIVGRTNMTEFAYSGLGLNPHYGTPSNPWDRSNKRIPGGSSSGAAVSVTDGFAYGAIGTDTGGSCRIPAALCGLVGYKPTQASVSRQGVTPLSYSLDSVGSLARTPRCVEILHYIMSGLEVPKQDSAVKLEGLRLLAPTNLVRDGMDEKVTKDFTSIVKFLKLNAVRVDERPIEALNRLPDINSKGGFAAAESLHWHRELVGRFESGYDPRVLKRIIRGREQSAVDFIELGHERKRVIADVAETAAQYDAIVMPTVPIVAPRLGEVCSSDERYDELNMLLLRNPSIINFLDGCSASIPMHSDGTPPTGFMISSLAAKDARVLGISSKIYEMFRSA